MTRAYKPLNKYLVTELKQIAKENGLKGYGGLRKNELIDFISNNLYIINDVIINESIIRKICRAEFKKIKTVKKLEKLYPTFRPLRIYFMNLLRNEYNFTEEMIKHFRKYTIQRIKYEVNKFYN